MTIEGRVVGQQKSVYEVDTVAGTVRATLRGALRRRKARPITGDIVDIELPDESTPEGQISAVRPRRNFLNRPSLANIDFVLLVTTVKEPPVGTFVIDQFLFNAAYHELPVALVFNKSDLLDAEELAALRVTADVYVRIGYRVLTVSAKSGDGLGRITELCAGKVSSMAGVSGVGKSALCNRLLPGRELRVGELSYRFDRGVHTTTSTSLLRFDGGGYLADTPGFALLDLPSVPPEEVSLYFPELESRIGACRFNNCLHENEPGCAIKAMAETGEIAPSRYRSYREFVVRMRAPGNRYGRDSERS